MFQTYSQRIFNLLSGLWVGCLLTIGFLVVPTLFSSLGDRQVAGMVAANLFKSTAYISVLTSIVLMVLANYFVRVGKSQYRIDRWILLGMLACAIAAAFIIIPWMNSLRDQALYLGLSVRESTHAVLFSRLHGISSAIYMLQTMLGIVLVWRVTKNADQRRFNESKEVLRAQRFFLSAAHAHFTFLNGRWRCSSFSVTRGRPANFGFSCL